MYIYGLPATSICVEQYWEIGRWSLVWIKVGETINSPNAIHTIFLGQVGRIKIKIFGVQRVKSYKQLTKSTANGSIAFEVIWAPNETCDENMMFWHCLDSKTKANALPVFRTRKIHSLKLEVSTSNNRDANEEGNTNIGRQEKYFFVILVLD